MKSSFNDLRVRRSHFDEAGNSVPFTLIELLVVISIIAILFGLLIPVIMRAKDKAKATACVSNMKQIAEGFNLYCHDFNGIIVAGRMPGITGSSNVYDVGNGQKFRPRWYAQLGSSSGFYPFSNPSPLAADDNTQQVDNKAFLCPQVPDMCNGRNYCYGYNFQFLGNSRFNLAKTRYINWPRNIATIKDPSLTVMFGDCMGTAAGKPRSARLPYDDALKFGTSSNLSKIGNHAWALDPPRLVNPGTGSDTCDDSNRGATNRSALDPRHLGNVANVAFCDGHAESTSLEGIGYEVGSDGTIGINGNNKSFSGTSNDDNPPDIN